MSDEPNHDNPVGDSAAVTLPGTVDKIIPAIGNQPERHRLPWKVLKTYIGRFGWITRYKIGQATTSV